MFTPRKFVCRDKDNVIIICYQNTWDNHILGEHPEVRGWESYVQDTISHPYQIYQDPKHPNKKAHYKPFILPKPFNVLYLRVCIEYKNSRLRGFRGFVQSAFPCPTIRKGDILIWQQK